MNKKNIVLTLIFAAIVAAVLISRLLDIALLQYIVGPLIMPWVAVYFLVNAKKRTFRAMVLTAFFFSWVGDILLLLSAAHDNDSFFFAGIGSFSLSLVIYIFIYIFSTENDIKGLLLRNPLWIIPLAAYCLFLVLLLYPGLEGFSGYLILAYVVILTSMSIAALNRRDRVYFISFRLVFAGSLFFLISGSLMAVHLFHTEIPYAGFMITLTYLAAQYFIVRGLILEKERPAGKEQ